MPKPENKARKKNRATILCRKRVYTRWRNSSPGNTSLRPMESKPFRAWLSKRSTAVPMDTLLSRIRLRTPRPHHHVVQAYAQESEQGERSQHWLRQPLPDGVAPRDGGIAGQAAVALRIGRIVQHVDHVCAADRLRVVHARLVIPEVLAQLLGALFGDEFHVVFRAELQAACWAGLDAGRLQALPHAVGTERALVDLLGRFVEARNVERAAGDAELAADAVLLLEVDDAVGVLHDGSVGGAGMQAAGVGAVHALVLAHQPLDGAVFPLVLVKFDEVPEIPARLRHGLVGVVEGGRRKRHVVPFDAGHFASLAANAGRRVNQLTDVVIALHFPAGLPAGNGAGVGRHLFDLQQSSLAHRSAPYAFSSFTRKPLNSGLNAVGSMTVVVS